MAAIVDNTAVPRGQVGTVRFDALTSHDLLRHVDDTPAVREKVDDADLVLAGSTGAVWPSRVAGAELPERIHAPALADALCAAGNADGRGVCPAAPPGPPPCSAYGTRG
jgi:UDP-N-acetyl-D-mannosaminuronic acid transferase (WecB/TagA/CpsF family)